MNNALLTIGPVSLQGFEVPNGIQFGGQQRIALHRLLDGSRFVETLGPEDSELSFGGTFSGQDAVSRARTLDQIRLSGSTVPLTWQSYRYAVVIRQFRANYVNPWWIEYSVSCTIADQSASSLSSSPDSNSIIANDLISATDSLSDTTIELAPIFDAASLAGALVPGTAANTEAIASTQSVIAVINLTIAAASESISAGRPTTGDPQTYAINFLNDLDNAGTLAALSIGLNYVGRAAIYIDQGGR